ncbi:MAG: hypothetical protein HY986_15540 [Candidatus Melainabacteria bacterium]|nr:hypothetical protein [Candidatus Melainabacteria bacterium]
MKIKAKQFKGTLEDLRVLSLLSVAVISLVQTAPALAQGSPIPGANRPPSVEYGTVGQVPQGSASRAPVPGMNQPNSLIQPTQPAQARSRYMQLPLTVVDAKTRLDELRLLLTSQPKEAQERIYEMCEWLSDGADAHYRMYQAFSKSDLTKTQAASEKQLNQSFSQLKREAQLLKADLLIKQGRAPEALNPLVERVIADPRSLTGQNAYKRLVELGFSKEASEEAQISGLLPGAPTAKSAK